MPIYIVTFKGSTRSTDGRGVIAGPVEFVEPNRLIFKGLDGVDRLWNPDVHGMLDDDTQLEPPVPSKRFPFVWEPDAPALAAFLEWVKEHARPWDGSNAERLGLPGLGRDKPIPPPTPAPAVNIRARLNKHRV